MKINPRLFLLSCAAASAMLSGTAMAQDADTEADEARKLETVTVTATRTGETDLQTTAIAVAAYDAETLEKRNTEDLQDVARFTPGLSILGQAGRGNAGGSVAIRGIGTDTQEAQPSTGIYIDEVYFPSGVGNVLGLLDVEAVEVLRGPQGTLFGRNTIAGAIQYRSTVPGDELSGYAKGSIGSANLVDLEGAVTIPLHETLSVRVSGMTEEIDGFVDNLATGDTEGDTKTTAARIRAVWEPTDALSIDLKAETISTEQDGRNNLIGAINPNAQFPFLASIGLGIPGVPPVDLTGFDSTLVLPFGDPDDFAIAGLNAPDSFDFDYTVFQAIVSYDLTENLTLKSLTAKIDSESELLQDFDGTPFAILATETYGELEAFSQEFQLSGTAFNDNLSFVSGIYYYDDEDIGTASALVGIGNLPPGGSRSAAKTESISAYGQATYNLTDAVSVAFGLRYTDETVTTSIVGQPGTDLEFAFDDVSPHLGINFEMSDDVFLYAKASKGFRAGGNTADTGLPNNGLSFDPEEAWTYEFGARTVINDVLRINPTVFFTEWSDLQSNIIIFLPAPTATVQNIGDVEIYGLELESEWLVTDNFTVNFSAALSEAEYTSFQPILTSNGGISADATIPGLPDVKYTIGGTYDHQFSNGMMLNLSADYSYTAEQRSALQDAGAIDLDSYGILGARATLDVSDNFAVSVFGSNLTDEVYFIGGTDFANGNTVGNQELNVARGRAYGVEGKFSF